MSKLYEAFKELDLLEDIDFDVNDEEDLKKLDDFLNDTNDLEDIEMIVDYDAENEDELKDSYVGSLLLLCPHCRTIHYANPIEVVASEEDPTLVNVGETCSHCKANDGFEVVGKVAPYEPEEDLEQEDDVDTDTDLDDTTDLDDDTDIDFELEDEEEFDGKESLKSKSLKESKSKTTKKRKSLIESIVEGDLTRDDFDDKENLPELSDGEDVGTDLEETRVGSRLPRVKKQIKETKLEEKPVYGLNPQYDSRKSFYGKAQVDTGDKGDQNKLYSYDTLVAEIKDGKPVVYGTYSQTTLRHIKDWLKQNGFKAESAKQIMNDYGVKNESCGKKLKEAVEDEAYAIADYVVEKLFDGDKDTYPLDEFEQYIADACLELYGDDINASEDIEFGKATINGKDFDLNDLSADVRAILSTMGWNTNFSNGDLTTNAVEENLKEDKSLKETGEWEDDEQGINWKKYLANLIRKYTGNKVSYKDMDGFDKYQGPEYNDGNFEYFTDGENQDYLLVHDIDTTVKAPCWYRVGSKEDFKALMSGNLEPLKENLKESTKVTAKEIEKYISDLPNYKELAEKIANYVNSHDNYTNAQIGQIIDDFTGESIGLGVADDIECLFESCKENLKESKSLKESAGDVYYDILDRAKMNIDAGYDVDDAIWDAVDNGLIYTADEFEVIQDVFSASDLYTKDGEPVSTYVMEHIYNEIYGDVQDYYNEKHENNEDEEIDESLKKEHRTTEQIKESIKTKLDKTLTEAKDKLSKEAKFLKNAYENLKEDDTSTWFYDLGLDSGLHLVVGKLEDEICVKIAFNSDDLQSDYDWDWEMPTYKDGEVAFVEDALNDNTDFNQEAEYLVKEAKAMDEKVASGELLVESKHCEEIDESLFDSLINKYCKRVYENVDTYKTEKGQIEKGKIILEGKITYKSGKFNNTKFIFEKRETKNNVVRYYGLNETFSKSAKAFILQCKVDNKKLLSESLTYNYKVKLGDKSKKLYGRVENKK